MAERNCSVELYLYTYFLSHKRLLLSYIPGLRCHDGRKRARGRITDLKEIRADTYMAPNWKSWRHNCTIEIPVLLSTYSLPPILAQF